MERLLVTRKENISIVTVCLGLYFIMMPFDSFPMFGIGSLLRIVVLFPVGAILFIKMRDRLHINAMTVMLAIYCLALVVTCVYSLDMMESFRQVRRMILNIAIIICVGGMYDYNRREINFLKGCLVVGGLATLALTFRFADYSDSGRLTLSINGVTQDQNFLNGYLFFAYTYFFSQFFKNYKIYDLIPVGGIVYFTLLTGSRGALLSLVIISCFCVFYVLYSEKRLNFTTIAIVAVLVILLIVLYKPILSLLPAQVAERFSPEYIADHGNTGRSDIWQYLLLRYRHSTTFRTLFGYGYGMVVVVNEFNHLVAHNLWLDHLIMGGLFGEMIFLGMQFVFFKAAWQSKDVFLLGCYVGFLVMMMTLTLLTYKPVFNCMIMIMIIDRYQKIATEEVAHEV